MESFVDVMFAGFMQKNMKKIYVTIFEKKVNEAAGRLGNFFLTKLKHGDCACECCEWCKDYQAGVRDERMPFRVQYIKKQKE